MKRTLTFLSLTLIIGSLMACSPHNLDENDSDLHGQSAAREVVGISEPDSTQDKIVHNTQVDRGGEVDLNDQIYISSNTTPVGNEQTYQEIVTDPYGTQVTRDGEIAGQSGMSDATSDKTTPATQALAALSAPELSTLRDLLTKADMQGVLTQGQHTLLAPSNLAFSQLSAEQLNQLKQDKNLLQQVLLYHVVLKPMSAQTLTTSPAPATLFGGKTLNLQQAKILRPNLRAGDSFVHVIDKVLLPETLPQS